MSKLFQFKQASQVKKKQNSTASAQCAKRGKVILRYVASALFFMFYVSNASAFKLTLGSNDEFIDRKAAKQFESVSWVRSFVNLVGDPVHERITMVTFGCEYPNFEICAQPDWMKREGFSINDVLRGVRWNDNPTFEITEGFRSTCKGLIKAGHMRDHCVLASIARAAAWSNKPIGRGQHPFSLVAMSHFRDMQFLHAMASIHEKSADDTRKSILLWCEFFYRMSSGEWKPYTRVKDMKDFPRFVSEFRWSKEWRLGMFTDYVWNPQHGKAKGIAFGSLLHILQDSFAECHVHRIDEEVLVDGTRRSEQRIRQFLSFVDQDNNKHGKGDKNYQLILENVTHNKPNPIDIGKRLLEFREQNTPWDKGPAALLDEHFRLAKETVDPTDRKLDCYVESTIPQ
jgi:hypothetical protein